MTKAADIEETKLALLDAKLAAEELRRSISETLQRVEALEVAVTDLEDRAGAPGPLQRP